MTNTDKALAAWGRDMPDWVRALAEACDDKGLRRTAGAIGVSPAMASLAVNRQRDKLDFIKAKVTATLMVTIIACPVMGVMGKTECLQEQAKPFSAANPLRIQLYRACRNGCPHFKERNNDGIEGQPKEKRRARRRNQGLPGQTSSQ